jgi:hypothetical protein
LNHTATADTQAQQQHSQFKTGKKKNIMLMLYINARES